MGKTYPRLDEFDSKTAESLEAMMYSDEEFVSGIRTYANFLTRTGWKYEKMSRKLILTNQRLLMYKRGWIREVSEDYNLDEITSIGFEKNLFSAKMSIQGAGIDESYKLPKDEGREFATKARELLSKKDDSPESISHGSN